MAGTRYKLSKSHVLQYALDGARTTKALNYEVMNDEERNVIDKDIAELQRRIKLVDANNTKPI